MDKDETYNGWTNWETWNTALMLNNEQDIQRRALDMARYHQQARFEDYAIRAVIAPHNDLKLQDAEDWNKIPVEERPGDDKDDIVPWLIDEAKVNWHEIFESFRQALRESGYTY